jgi:hypothetical protein
MAVSIQVDLAPRSDGGAYCGLEVQFGDGEAKTLRIGDNGLADIPLRVEHTYAKSGEYFIRVDGKLSPRGLKTALPCSGSRQELKVIVSDSAASTAANSQSSSVPQPQVAAAANPAVVTPTQQKPAAPEALDSCMKTTMAKGALIGGIAGGLLGAFFGGKDQAKNAAIGAGLGAAAGGAIAWQGSFKSCSQGLNLVTSNSLKTEDYKDTSQRYKYSGQGSVLKIENASVAQTVSGGQSLDANLTLALLTPDGLETEVQVMRAFQCGSTQIPVQQERFKVTPGTSSFPGRIQMPSLSGAIGRQDCTMLIGVAASGLKDEWQGKFAILPNQ